MLMVAELDVIAPICNSHLDAKESTFHLFAKFSKIFFLSTPFMKDLVGAVILRISGRVYICSDSLNGVGMHRYLTDLCAEKQN